jgi:acetylornithine/succinyldiaminopimelate/putrescine aminotransferase
MTSGLGVLALGHNHPVVIEAEKFCHNNNIIDLQKLGPNRLQSVLAHNLSQLLPGDLNITTLSVSGAEANEAAIKLVTRAKQDKRKKFIIIMEGAYHGKTHGALSLTDSEGFNDGFLVGIPKENILKIPHGDLDAFRRIINEHRFSNKRNDIIAVFIETMGGQDLQTLPEGFLTEMCQLSRENKIYSVFDEIKVGMGRAGNGNLFCFEKEDAVPDVVTLSKALGGGKRAIGAMVTSNKLFKLAYGTRDDCALHSSTFSGLGESCAVAIETLNYLSDQNFLNDVHDKATFLKDELIVLQERYPKYIKSIKGEGLFLGIEFDFGWVSKVASISNSKKISKIANGVGIAAIVRKLFRDYGVLCHFTGSNPSVLHLMPPLIISESELKIFLKAIRGILDKSFESTLLSFITGNMKDIVR